MTERTVTDIRFPKCEQTIKRNGYRVGTYALKNDLGHPCEYRVLDWRGKAIGEVTYYRGRLLCVFPYAEKQP